LPARGAWQVYVIACSDASLYTGITTDIDRRFGQHASGRGARYFRGRKPRRVVFLETGHTRSSAGCREAEIKHFSRSEKLRLIRSPLNQLGRRREKRPDES
jgi:putative endonuclease